MYAYMQVLWGQASVNDFILQTSIKIAFIPKEEASEKITISNIAAKETRANIEGDTPDPLLRFLWQVRWSAKGLLPVKPTLHLMRSGSLPAGRALSCNAAKAAAI